VRERAKARPRDQLGYLYRSVLGHTFAKQPHEELNHEAFARHLLTQFPVSSHMFIRPQARGTRNTWLYTPGCIQPGLDALLQCFEHVTLLLKICVVARASVPQISFSGHTASFDDMIAHLMQLGSTSRLLGISIDGSDIEKGLTLPMMTALPQAGPGQERTWRVDVEQQTRLLESLRQNLSERMRSRKILLLASAPSNDTTTSLAIGLVVTNQNSSGHGWQRLGWCIWAFRDQSPHTLVSTENKGVGLDGVPFERVAGDAE
jgi:hypothetical protein